MHKALNMSNNFSNESSRPQNVTCDVFLVNYFPVKIVKVLLYSIILLSSLVGNALIITIVRKRTELRNTINYFIVNMAVSDFVYPLTVIPVQLTQIATSSMQWCITGTVGLIFCKLTNFLEDVSISVSIQSLVWIALDRFVAVVLPMKVHLISSRFRVFAMASTWLLAMVGNCLDFYIYELAEEGEEKVCMKLYGDTLLIKTYAKVRTTVFLIAPFVAMTVLYCVIAVTLRRQDKALHCSAVHQKDQRKRRAIKMSFCIMTSFYIAFLPVLVGFLIKQYEVTVSCSFLKALWFLAPCAVYISSVINPIICILFVQSYRRGLKEIIISCWSKRFTNCNVETGEQNGVSLEEIRVTVIEYCSLAYPLRGRTAKHGGY